MLTVCFPTWLLNTYIHSPVVSDASRPMESPVVRSASTSRTSSGERLRPAASRMALYVNLRPPDVASWQPARHRQRDPSLVYYAYGDSVGQARWRPATL